MRAALLILLATQPVLADASADARQLAELGFSGDGAGDEKCPGAEDGHELIGSAAREWTFSDWVNSPPLTLAKLRGRVVVVRFWTVECPFCERSMPALERLAAEFKGQPLTIIGAFHAKPVDTASDMKKAAQVAKGWGVGFALAFDRQWRTLRSWYLDGHHRQATSATFVIGKDGKIVHVHPGPVYFPSDAAADAQKNRDFAALRQAIVKALH